MPFDWSDYLALSQELFQGVQDSNANAKLHDAKLRSAVSRAYYSAYHVGRNHLEKVLKKTYPTTGKAHRLVADDLQERDAKLGQALKNLKRMRLEADYRTQAEGLFNMAKMSIARSIQIIRKLK